MPGHAGDREDLLAGEMLVAGERDARDVETGRVCGRIARIAQRLDDLVDVAAPDGAENDAPENDQRGARQAEAARRPQRVEFLHAGIEAAPERAQPAGAPQDLGDRREAPPPRRAAPGGPSRRCRRGTGPTLRPAAASRTS